MKKYAFNEITTMQYIMLIHGTQVGIGLFALPRLVAETAGTSGWISIFIGWLLSLLASLVIIQVMKRHPQYTIIDLLKHYFGKWIGALLSLGFAVYFALFTFIVLDRSVLYIKAIILQRTADYVLILLFLIPGVFVVRNGIRILGRYSELVFFFSLWLPLLFLYVLKDANWLHLLPVLKDGILPVVKTVKSTVISFLGFEVAYFIYPFLQKKQHASAGIVVANSLTLLVYLHVTITSFLFFSPDQITFFNEPTLTALRIIEFRFLERFDMLVLAFYMFYVSTTWMPVAFCSVFTTSQLLGKQNHSKHFYWFCCILIVITYITRPTFELNEKMTDMINLYGMIVAFLFPVFLWLLMAICGRVVRKGGTA